MKKLYELQYDYVNASNNAYNQVVEQELTLKELVEIGYNMIHLDYNQKIYRLGYDEEDFTEEELNILVKGLYTDYDSDGYEIVFVELVNEEDIDKLNLNKDF